MTTTHHAEAILRAAFPNSRLVDAAMRFEREAILAAVREAVEAERKAVVAWFRNGAGNDISTLSGSTLLLFTLGLNGYADAIEAGRHLPTPPRGE